MSKKKNNKDSDLDLDSFDLEGSTDSDAEVVKLKSEVERLEKLAFSYEKIIRENGLTELLSKTITDEEYICLKGIETIKKLVANEIQTKDDINMFDVLYRNLNTIRGIKVDKKPKEKPKTREELISLIKGGASK